MIAEKRNVWEQELLLQELKNAFLKLIDVSRKGEDSLQSYLEWDSYQKKVWQRKLPIRSV